MPSSSNIQNPETVPHNSQNITASLLNLSAGTVVNVEVEDDEEEEDVDFNPFLREGTPSEASSSLSSENDCLGDNAKKLLWSSGDCLYASAPSQPTDKVGGYGCDTGKEETVMQTRLEEVYGRDIISEKSSKRGLTSPVHHDGSVVCLSGSSFFPPYGDVSASADGLREEDMQGQGKGSSSSIISGKPIMQFHADDAISRRTRARHSLANYTLEELETFLQESDEDDLQNVDDEEEYHKFLAAVLLGGDVNERTDQEDENIDEDEENDADFVIEIEEALESDIDESLNNNEGRSDKREGVAHRLKTRQKKCLKDSVKDKDYHLGQAKMPLRPILPNTPNTYVVPFSTVRCQSCPKSFSHCSSCLSGTDLLNGFTAHQIGQLYSLIYEHIQLLIQTFSISVLDSSRQQVATEVQNMVSEMVEKREEALSCRKVPYPAACFHPQNLHSSLDFDIHQTTKCYFWTPLIDNPVLSVLDVAPLGLAKGYLNDVSATVSRHRRRHLEDLGDKSYMERKPIFPLHTAASFSETVNGIREGSSTMSPNIVQPFSPGQVSSNSKKPLAATLVKSTKKSVALVPKDIAKLAYRFYPLFNSELFPHNPPIPSIANRALFTDAEDGLLAMGLMEYNNDWMAIQRRFLPCKTEHQIFVRQKNRSSSKAHENPIKAVRRMKSSPLTADEIACIKEGLKLFKHDWCSIWKFFVPHRDPSLIRRQWRVATGTQKSYKKSEDLKKRRRLYDARRRRFKALSTDCQTSSEKEAKSEEDTTDDMGDEDEAYVHEAFLADGEPRSSKHMPYDIPFSSISGSNMQSTYMMPYGGTHIIEKCAFAIDECRKSQQNSGAIHEVGTSSKSLGDIHEVGTSSKSLGDMHHLSHISHVTCSTSFTTFKMSSNSISKRSTSHLGSWPFHMHKCKGDQVVKLSPDLPPVNLPSSVRVISQTAFKSYSGGPSCSYAGDSAVANHLHWLPQVPKDRTAIAKPGDNVNNFLAPQINTVGNENILADRYVAEENTSESDLHMHPLLFKVPEQLSSCYPLNCAASGTFNFFPEAPLRVESSLLKTHNSDRDHTTEVSNPEEASLQMRVVDFHPLLQRVDNVSGDSSVMPLGNRLSGEAEALQGNCDNFLNPADCTAREVLISDSRLETDMASPSQEGKENDVDLNIQIYSTTDTEKTTKGIDMTTHEMVREGIPALELRMLEDDLRQAKLFLNHGDKCPKVSGASNSPVRTFSERDIISLESEQLKNSMTYQYRNDSRDKGVPEIVMEQEELSDSDEEIQQVEFEYEEMDDSEGEGLNSEQPTEVQTKKLPTLGSKEGGIQAIHQLSQTDQSSDPTQAAAAAEAEEDSESQMKPRHVGAKRDRSCKSSASKTKNAGSFKSNRRLRTVAELASVASRRPRPRKRSLSK